VWGNRVTCTTYVEHSLHADSQSHFGYLIQVVSKEPRVGNDCVVGKGLDTGARLETGAWFVEGNVSIGSNATEEQLDATDTLDLIFIVLALGLEVRGVAVEDVDVFWLGVDVGEEVLVHEAVVAFWMVSWDANILVLIGSISWLSSTRGCCATLEANSYHVERDHIAERDMACFVALHQVFVDEDGAAPCGQA
jgi:hypothetical protein